MENPRFLSRRKTPMSNILNYNSHLIPFESLLKENGGKWTLTADKMGIERIFRFKGFKDSWNFMNDVAARCKQEKHHPEWVNIYNMVFIRWTTHVPHGLTSKDILMAGFCDAQAAINNEKIHQPQDSSSRELSDQTAQISEGGEEDGSRKLSLDLQGELITGMEMAESGHGEGPNKLKLGEEMESKEKGESLKMYMNTKVTESKRGIKTIIVDYSHHWKKDTLDSKNSVLVHAKKQ
ncbi:hypothetical protein DID88_000051 [Monilinia fructigena]|uniref:4a-hydroxytetrahydrobiopterin dehydratase n=1 Tax=Monilinia fructigena TaxID=38457 RepID=A0A395IJA5_9HELO|nr:hypothetical protein DID88_000051 [Monilinia fructigena]